MPVCTLASYQKLLGAHPFPFISINGIGEPTSILRYDAKTLLLKFFNGLGIQQQHEYNDSKYHQISNIRRTKFQNLNVSPLALLLSWYNILKPGVKLRMKLEQRRLHLSDQQLHRLMRCVYIRVLRYPIPFLQAIRGYVYYYRCLFPIDATSTVIENGQFPVGWFWFDFITVTL